MRGNLSRDTRPELAVRSAVHRLKVVSRGECTTGVTWDPREGSHRPSSGQARGRPMREPAYEPSPQVKPVVHSLFDATISTMVSGVLPNFPLPRHQDAGPARLAHSDLRPCAAGGPAAGPLTTTTIPALTSRTSNQPRPALTFPS